MSQPSSDEIFSAAELFEAVVQAVEDGRLEVRHADRGGARLEARNAVHGYAPSEGDRVLCAGRGGAIYVTGVLMAPPPTLPLGDATARVESGQLVIRGEDGELVLSFDPSSGETRLRAGRAALVLEAAERLSLRAPEVTVDAEQLTQRVGRLVTEADQIATSVQRWDLRAGKITERARDAFRDVKNLLQTRAGTVRTIARGGLSMFAARTHIRSKKDTAVDGERVLLG